MPRPRSDKKRSAILEAATRVIVAQGLGAPTAGIAEEAGVANGSLFTYFETKAELFNQLFLDLKQEMATVAMQGVLEQTAARERLSRAWTNWTHWAVSFPSKRNVLAQLTVSAELTDAARLAGKTMMAPLAELVEDARVGGPLAKVPLGFVLALMNSVAEATMEFMIQDPANAKRHSKIGFEAVWRMIT